MEWQPIETAPKDGTRILARLKHLKPKTIGYDLTAIISFKEYVRTANGWPPEYWVFDKSERPIRIDDYITTHWMPLPEPPSNV